MKAIAFAIICAAYLLLPAEEFNKLSDNSKNWLGLSWLLCIIGFWFCIFIEK